MAALPVEVVNAAGEITSANEPWFDAAPDTNAVIIAVLGPQASGKSTLANELFGTAFPVAARTSVGSATTRGILAARPVERPDVVVLDVEGADARERGRNGRNFQARCASFVANLADCMIINMWYHDTCRVDSTGFELLRNMLLTCAQAIADGSSVRSALVFAIRDVEDDVDPESLQGVVSEDVGFNCCSSNLAVFPRVDHPKLTHFFVCLLLGRGYLDRCRYSSRIAARGHDLGRCFRCHLCSITAYSSQLAKVQGSSR